MFKYLALGAAAAYTLYLTFFGNDQNGDDRPPHPPPPPSYKPTRPAVRRHDERQVDQRILGSSQYQQTTSPSQRDNTLTETWTLLRDRAKQEAKLMSQCFQQSTEAYQRRDHARANALSDLGKRHELEMENLNAKAAAIIFKENNKNKSPCDVDLHGLSVKEAIEYSERVVEEARQRYDPEIRLIVGRGTHSDGGIPRLKPALLKDLRKRGIQVEVHATNPGVLRVRLEDE